MRIFIQKIRFWKIHFKLKPYSYVSNCKTQQSFLARVAVAIKNVFSYPAPRIAMKKRIKFSMTFKNSRFPRPLFYYAYQIQSLIRCCSFLHLCSAISLRLWSTRPRPFLLSLISLVVSFRPSHKTKIRYNAIRKHVTTLHGAWRVTKFASFLQLQLKDLFSTYIQEKRCILTRQQTFIAKLHENSSSKDQRKWLPF